LLESFSAVWGGTGVFGVPAAGWFCPAVVPVVVVPAEDCSGEAEFGGDAFETVSAGRDDWAVVVPGAVLELLD